MQPQPVPELSEGQKRLQRLKEEEATFNPWGTQYKLSFTKVEEVRERRDRDRIAGSPTKRVLEDPITHKPYNK